MRAFSTANGGVMFIPDEIERVENKAVSYNDLVQEDAKIAKRTFMERLLGRSKKEDKELRKAA
jgi:hypothetical protein